MIFFLIGQKTAPKFWIWTSKIIPDRWSSAVCCQFKKIKITPPLLEAAADIRYRRVPLRLAFPACLWAGAVTQVMLNADIQFGSVVR